MQDRSPEAEKSLSDKLGLFGATFYHFESANLGVESVVDLKEKLEEFNPAGIKTFVLDMENVVFMNDRGAHILLGLRSRFRKLDSNVVLLDLQSQPKEKLEQIGILDDFLRFDSEEVS